MTIKVINSYTKMINKIVRNTKIGVLFVCTLLFILTNINNKNYAIADDAVITTHIWATNYDKTYHWEYCTVCGSKRNVEAHSMEQHWYLGYESCIPSNYCTNICECGYNYTHRKEHSNLSNWQPFDNRYIHYLICGSCTYWISPTRCYNENGYMSCKNQGKCLACGLVPTPDMHYISSGGMCRDCGEHLINVGNYTLEYAPDYSYCIIKYTWSAANERVTLTGKTSYTSQTVNFSSASSTSVENADGSYTYTCKFVFNPALQRKCTLYIPDCREIAYVGDTMNYADNNIYHITIWQDHEKPKVTEIVQEDQKMYGDWATIKQLTIKGTDNLSSIVKISIIDKETGEKVVDAAKVDVKNGNFTYTCTPPLEGPATGRKYICKVEDEVENVLDHEFTIYKTDSKPPTLASNDTYTQWSRQKEILFNITDYGAGGVQTSLVDQVSYKSTLKDGDNYYAEYYFGEENYGATTYNLYLKDGLGNATKTVVTVGKIDLTKPTIENTLAKKENTMVVATIMANDFSKRMNAEGSGPEMYAITEMPVVPSEGQWQKSNVVKAYNPGRYYLWVKDLAGNIGDAAVLDVDPKLNPDVDPNDKIIYDSGKKEKESINKSTAYDDNLDNKLKNIDDKSKYDKFDGKEIEKYDKTPQTGDVNYVELYLVLSIVSGIILCLKFKGKHVK